MRFIMPQLPYSMATTLCSAAILFTFSAWSASAVPKFGREVSIARHLQDGEEFTTPLPRLVAYGQELFTANWTIQEGGGRPLTKGNGNPLTDSSQPLVFPRNMNRVSAPDANSCAGCHDSPLVGGNGDFVANVFVTGQRFDFATFDRTNTTHTGTAVDERGLPVTLQSIANSRATPGMFGSGFIEMLARQMTADLQSLRDATPPGGTNALATKGVSFGKIIRRGDGAWDTSQVEGLAAPSLVTTGAGNPPTLIVRPFHQAGNVVSVRQFSNNAYNHHHGIQSTERFGVGADPDGDGYTNELTRADMTAVSVFQATMAVPGRVIPNDAEIEAAVLNGENLFSTIGCGVCHVPNLPLPDSGWVFTEPNPYNPSGNLRPGDAPELRVDLTSSEFPAPRLQPISGVVYVPAFTDLKLHDICGDANDPNLEPIDMNQPAGSAGFFAGNRKFLTRKLWGAASKPNFFHHGLFSTMREAILAHNGEAAAARAAFHALSDYDRDSVIEFLKTLRVLPPGTTSLFVDENHAPKAWPPARFSRVTKVGNQVRLIWPGDNGLYSPARLCQLQECTNVTAGDWFDLGAPTTSGAATVEAKGSVGLFRLKVQ
jgi:hypothetical protein